MLPCIDLQIAGILHIQQCRPHIDIHITNNVQRNIFCRIDRDTLCIGSAQFIHIAMRCYKFIINNLPALQGVGFRLYLRTRAIAILRFCARLRRKRAHWQNRQHHTRRKRCTEKSRTLFSHVLFPFSFVILQAPTPKGTVCSLSLPPPPYNISRGILAENRFEFLVELLKCLQFGPLFPGAFRSNENATQKKSPLPLLGKGF